MSIFRRSVRAHRQQFRWSLRPSLENLELRMALAVSQSALLAQGGSPPVVEHPTFQRNFDASANRTSGVRSSIERRAATDRLHDIMLSE